MNENTEPTPGSYLVAAGHIIARVREAATCTAEETKRDRELFSRFVSSWRVGIDLPAGEEPDREALVQKLAQKPGPYIRFILRAGSLQAAILAAAEPATQPEDTRKWLDQVQEMAANMMVLGSLHWPELTHPDLYDYTSNWREQ
jgi:hypothetical protein